MLKIQEYLRSGKTLENLNEEFGIVSCRHDTEPLVILNYDMIDSPKTHPLVRECRALTLEDKSWNLVAKSFHRFFNWGEFTEEMSLFNFNKFHTLSKEDGSLVVIYNYNGKWFGNTRGSFGHGQIQFSELTWNQAFCKALNIDSLQDLKLDPKFSYVCEFVSPWNKVVRRYPTPKMYLLSIFEGIQELTKDEIDSFKLDNYFVRPERYDFTSIEQIQTFLQEMSSKDATFEGVVIGDGDYRFKIKNPTYLSLHKMRGEGDNLFNPKYLIPFILEGNGDELLTYFPEVKEQFEQTKAKIENSYAQLVELWKQTWQIELQKDFALSIVKKTPFTAILFNLRKKYGKNQSEVLLNKEWRDSGNAILNILF